MTDNSHKIKSLFTNYVLSAFIFCVSIQTLSQDSTKIIFNKDTTTSSNKRDTTLKPMSFFLLKSKYQYINPSSPDTITRNRFLWYPLKSIEDVFSYLPGYYLGYMDVGQRQNLSYNQLDGFYTGVFRHGRPINDLIDGSFDLNLFSRNEISVIELTNGLGNFPYNYANGINVIQRQIAQNKPYSEMSFWQDRYENLYLDANFQQNIFRKLNFNFGITKHSYDGKYTNSDFDKWLGRFNFNYAFSNKTNGFLYANYSRIQRGLNGGVNPDTIDINNRSEVFDAALAVVRNPDAYEIRERFDIEAGAIFLTSKDSASYFKFQLFESNAFRKYRDEENRPTPNGLYVIENSHWINYGVKLQCLNNFRISNGARIISNTETEFNRDLIYSVLNDLRASSRIFLFQNFQASLKNFGANVYGKAYRFNYFSNKFYFDWGIKPFIRFALGDSSSVKVYASYSQENRLPSYQEYFLEKINLEPLVGNEPVPEIVTGFNAGAEVSLQSFRLKAEFYRNIVKDHIFSSIPNRSDGYKLFKTGFNGKLDAKLYKFDVDITATYSPKSLQTFFLINDIPEINGNINLSYHNLFFKNKLEIRIGINSRFWTSYYPDFYYGYYNMFSNRYGDATKGNEFGILKLGSNATLDFYIIAKINKATFGLTFENLLNRVIATTGFYPYMDRGGFANVISRFNITWYFLN